MVCSVGSGSWSKPSREPFQLQERPCRHIATRASCGAIGWSLGPQTWSRLAGESLDMQESCSALRLRPASRRAAAKGHAEAAGSRVASDIRTAWWSPPCRCAVQLVRLYTNAWNGIAVGCRRWLGVERPNRQPGVALPCSTHPVAIWSVVSGAACLAASCSHPPLAMHCRHSRRTMAQSCCRAPPVVFLVRDDLRHSQSTQLYGQSISLSPPIDSRLSA